MRQLLPAFNQDSPIFPLKKGKIKCNYHWRQNEGRKRKRYPTNKSSRKRTFWAHRNFLLPQCNHVT